MNQMPEVVQDVADHSSQLKANIDRLAQSVQSYRSALQKLADFRRRMKDQVAQVEHEIDKKAEELIQAIQRDKRQLLDDLASAEQTKMQEIDRLQNSVEVQLALVEGLNKHDEKLPSAENGDCEVMNGRMKRMDDLIEYPVSGLRKALVEVTSTGIEFIPAPSENENDDNNILGQVHVSTFEGSGPMPMLEHVFARGDAVMGITTVANQLFVARWPSQQQLEVYDALTFIFHRPLAVPGLSGRPGGLTSCSVNGCLYVSDFKNSLLFRIGLSDDHKATLTHWSVDRQPTGLSINSVRNVLVTCRGNPRKIQEYTYEGALVREISLPNEIVRPMHSAQLADGNFVVSSGGLLPGQFACGERDLHLLSVVDVTGAVIHSYGNTYGGEDGQLNEPMGLALNRDGSVLVADKDNNRIVAFDSSLTSARVVHLPVDGGLRGPFSLWLDECHNRLYVGEGIGGRLLIFGDIYAVYNFFNRN